MAACYMPNLDGFGEQTERWKHGSPFLRTSGHSLCAFSGMEAVKRTGSFPKDEVKCGEYVGRGATLFALFFRYKAFVKPCKKKYI